MKTVLSKNRNPGQWGRRDATQTSVLPQKSWNRTIKSRTRDTVYPSNFAPPPRITPTPYQFQKISRSLTTTLTSKQSRILRSNYHHIACTRCSSRRSSHIDHCITSHRANRRTTLTNYRKAGQLFILTRSQSLCQSKARLVSSIPQPLSRASARADS